MKITSNNQEKIDSCKKLSLQILMVKTSNQKARKKYKIKNLNVIYANAIIELKGKQK